MVSLCWWDEDKMLKQTSKACMVQFLPLSTSPWPMLSLAGCVLAPHWPPFHPLWSPCSFQWQGLVYGSFCWRVLYMHHHFHTSRVNGHFLSDPSWSPCLGLISDHGSALRHLCRSFTGWDRGVWIIMTLSPADMLVPWWEWPHLVGVTVAFPEPDT